jgi:hypothetical protein
METKFKFRGFDSKEEYTIAKSRFKEMKSGRKEKEPILPVTLENIASSSLKSLCSIINNEDIEAIAGRPMKNLGSRISSDTLGLAVRAQIEAKALAIVLARQSTQ